MRIDITISENGKAISSQVISSAAKGALTGKERTHLHLRELEATAREMLRVLATEGKSSRTYMQDLPPPKNVSLEIITVSESNCLQSIGKKHTCSSTRRGCVHS